MNKIIFPVILAFTSTLLAVETPVSVTVKTPVAGDAYRLHFSYKFEQGTTMLFQEDGQPPREESGPGYITEGSFSYNLEVISSDDGRVTSFRSQFGKLRDSYTPSNEEPGLPAEPEEIDDYPGLAGKSFSYELSGGRWQATGEAGTTIIRDDADPVLEFFGLDTGTAPGLFPPDAPLSNLLASAGKLSLNDRKPLGDKALSVLPLIGGFEPNPTMKASGTIALTGTTSDGHPIFNISADAGGEQPHEVFENFSVPTRIELDGKLVVDASSGWLRSSEFEATRTATYPMGIQGIVWTQTDTSTEISKSEYALDLNE